MSDLDQAIADGCFFKRDPRKLIEATDVDPLILPILLRINASGWVWTGESCQGHPDATGPLTWHGEQEEPGLKLGNTDPFVRLITRGRDVSHVMTRLLEACLPMRDHGPLRFVPRYHNGWYELRVYIGARTTYQRDQGLLTLADFAERLHV